MLIGPITQVGHFSYSDSSSFSLAVRYNYSVDLDNDGIDELIFAGFETQRNTPEDYDNPPRISISTDLVQPDRGLLQEIRQNLDIMSAVEKYESLFKSIM